MIDILEIRSTMASNPGVPSSIGRKCSTAEIAPDFVMGLNLYARRFAFLNPLLDFAPPIGKEQDFEHKTGYRSSFDIGNRLEPVSSD